MKLFEVFGVIKVDNTSANKKLKTTDGLGAKLGNTFGKAGKAVAVGVGVASVAMGAASIKAIGLASDAEEMQNKFDVTFKTMGKEADEWAKTWAKSVGRSEHDTKGFISNIADLQQGLGMTEEESLNLSKKIVELGTDLGSFNNINDAQAIEAVSKAMMGEAESAKQLGLLLNVERVKDFAESQGLVYEELTDAARATLVYELAVTQSTNAIGDAERSSGSFANQMKALKSSIKDASTNLGKYLLPMATKLVTFLVKKVAPAFEMLTDWIDEKAPVISEVLATVFEVVGEVIDVVVGIVQTHLIPAFKAVYNWVRDNMDTIKAVFKTVFDTIKSVVESFIKIWKEILLPTLQNVFKWVVDNFPAIQATFTEVFDKVQAITSDVIDIIVLLWQEFEKLLVILEPILTDIGKLMEDTFLDTLELISNVTSAIKEFLEVWAEGETIWEKMKTENPILTISRKMAGDEAEGKSNRDLLSDAFEKSFDLTYKILGIDTIYDALKGITHSNRAIGGNVTKGATYRVNEMGEEFFTPNQNGSIIPHDGLGGSGSELNINLNGATFINEQGIEDLTDLITDFLRGKGVNA